jgi:predicted AlkP superfamily phosphohydrolase/phosphomutase
MYKNSENKIMIIGLDGATFDVIRPLAEDGCLPNLAKLMNNSSHSDLESTIPYITPAAWSSFMTGKFPEKHSVIDFLEFIPKPYSTRLTNSQSIKEKTIWQILSEKGKKIAVIHLPMTYPPYAVNGIMVSGFDTPSVKSNFTYPNSLKREILNIIPDYDIHLVAAGDYLHEKDFIFFIDQLRKSIEQRYVVAKSLLKKDDWDVFMVNFQDIDRLQHHLWHYIDNKVSKDSDVKRKQIVANLFSYIDEVVGKLIDKGEGQFTHKMIVSDHGAGPAYMTVHPNSLLKEWGFLSICKQTNLSKHKRIYLTLKNVVKALRIGFHLGSQKGFINFSKDIVDWERTISYVPIADIAAFCYVNKQGRDEKGIVSDREYDDLCCKIRDRFMDICEPLSGLKVFKEVLIGKKYFKTYDNNSTLPDLILIPNDGFMVNKVLKANGFYSTAPHSGTHKINGVLIVNGNNVKKGFTGFKSNIVDMAPTILHILDLPVPSSMDGCPLLDIFTFNEHQTKWEDSETTHLNATETQVDYKEDEKKQIEERLKSLGYL